MPLRGNNHSDLVVRDDAPFFKTLAEFDECADHRPQSLTSILRYRARRSRDGGVTDSRGKLMLCHDYKGGYTESPSAWSYTFNFWPYCDTFVYFSHHRVTIPPSGWITAAHRHGVKMLGTLIFEGNDEEDCLRLLVGRLPQSKTGPVRVPEQRTIPVSPHYARRLAFLARQRGFDGYLLNFECPLRGGIEQTRALSSWISLLEYEMRREIGPHAQVVWYDSVIVDGNLRWQDRLNSMNLPFFLPSTGFFTNYTWPPHYPSLTAQYFLSINPQHLNSPQPKRLQDVYVGVDVWGRGSHGGGGFGAFKAINHIDPEFLGLSVALFGQAWSWETIQDEEGFTWDTWWAYERKLWLGPTGLDDVVTIPEPPPNQPVCAHGPFAPITSFFPRQPPPDPLDIAFYTSFSPGVGRAWFVEGVEVMAKSSTGWTDLDKTTSIGDLAWPHPAISSELGEWEGEAPVVSSQLYMYDAWMGGSSLRLDVTIPPADGPSFSYIWIPVQSLSLSGQQSYDVKLVYKIQSDAGAEVDLGLSVRGLVEGSENAPEIEVTDLPVDDVRTTGGWTHTSIRVRIESTTSSESHMLAAGLVLGIAQETPLADNTLSIFLGQLTAFPSPSVNPTSVPLPQVLWADYQKHASTTGAGVLTWEVAHSLLPVTNLSITSIEDPQPAWAIDTHIRTFLYFNIYIEVGEGDAKHPVFIGTSGLDGAGNRFFVESACLPAEVVGSKEHRFTVQGVTDRGEVLSQDRCVFVDVAHTA